MFDKVEYPFKWEHKYGYGNEVKGKRLLMPPLEVLKFLFIYDPKAGKLFSHYDEDGESFFPFEAGCKSDSGYIQVEIVDSNGDLKKYAAHRLILALHGEEITPDVVVDHINGNRSDNRMSNLRAVSWLVNGRNRSMQSNNSSGFNGVNWHKKHNKWVASIRMNGKEKRIGLFDCKEDAHLARCEWLDNYNKMNPSLAFSKRHGSQPNTRISA